MGVKPFPRAGAFCVLDKKVGIVFEYPQVAQASPDTEIVTLDHSSAEVHFLDSNGETESKIRNVPVGALSQAKLSQIPSKRRPTEAQAKKYGYK